MTEPQQASRPAPGRKRSGHGDIATPPRPNLAADAWLDPAQAIETLRDWAEAHTSEAIDWYLADKRLKRVGSRAARALAVIFATVGGIIPLISGAIGVDVAIGYAFLALSAGCVAFDHFFGLSAGWMRDITTAQTLQQRLMTFQILWARWQADRAGVRQGPLGEAELDGWPAALDMIEALMLDVQRATSDETAGWVSEFKESLSSLDRLTNAKGSSTEDLGGTHPA